MTRRVLVALLAVGMAVLSFDALRAYALTGRPLVDGVIPTQTILPRPWLAMLWAVVIDLAVLAGILGVKDDRRDWRAWAMLLLALAATLGFQVFALSPFVARAVPPVGLALAILVLDLGPGRPKPERATGPPLPARAHAWLRSWDDVPVVPAQVGPPPGPGHPTQPTRPKPATQPDGFTPAQLAVIEQALAEKRSALSISRELGLSQRAYKTKLLPYVRDHAIQPNGSPL